MHTPEEVAALRQTLTDYNRRKKALADTAIPGTIKMVVPLPLVFAEAVDHKARTAGITRGEALRDYVMAGIASEAMSPAIAV
jgi:hypothetical protein